MQKRGKIVYKPRTALDKAQVALEFLMTYGWVIMAVLVAIYEIYTYDLATRQEMRIPADASYSLWDAAVYGDKLVLNDYRNGNYDIYMYDFSTGKETQITSEPEEQTSPDIYENKIVWTDYRNYWGDIYMAIIS